MTNFFDAFSSFTFAFLLIVNSVYLLQFLLSAINLFFFNRRKSYSDYKRYITSGNMIPVSLLIPAFQEEAVILESVKNALSLNYPEYEVVVINDGSKDETLALLVAEYQLKLTSQTVKKSVTCGDIIGVYRSENVPNLVVVDKVNGGSKADAINAGINASTYPVIVITDADSLLEHHALIQIVMPFMRDSAVVAVGGNVKIAGNCEVKDGRLIRMNLPKSILARFQVLEYSRTFFSTRLGFERIGALPLISGAFGAFKKDVVIKVGGYKVNSMGEDMDLTFRIHEYMRNNKCKYKIKFLIDTVCWTQPPVTLHDLRSQRRRWEVGFVKILWDHKNMLFRLKYGLFGMFVIPFYAFFEFAGPILEFLGYFVIIISVITGFIYVKMFLLFIFVVMTLGTILSLISIILEDHTEKRYQSFKDIFTICLYSVIDSFGYHQLTTLFKIEGLVKYRKLNKWQVLKRTAMKEVE